MKFIIALACLVAVAFAVDDVPVLRNVLEVTPEGYNYAYELGNGILAEETGSFKNPETISAQGQYKFISPEGESFNVQYIADENGYQPTGAHLPVAPEIPILIQKALAYLATAKPYVEKNEKA